MGLLFIPQVPNEHGEQWWSDDVDRGNSRLVNQSYMAILLAEASGSKQEEWAKELEFSLTKYF
jgi:hypothetical protein